MVERQLRSGDTVGIDAGDLATGGAVGDADDVAVLLGEQIEGRLA